MDGPPSLRSYGAASWTIGKNINPTIQESTFPFSRVIILFHLRLFASIIINFHYFPLPVKALCLFLSLWVFTLSKSFSGTILLKNNKNGRGNG